MQGRKPGVLAMAKQSDNGSSQMAILCVKSYLHCSGCSDYLGFTMDLLSKLL